MFTFRMTIKTETETYRYCSSAFNSVDAINSARDRYSDAMVISAVKL